MYFKLKCGCVSSNEFLGGFAYDRNTSSKICQHYFHDYTVEHFFSFFPMHSTRCLISIQFMIRLKMLLNSTLTNTHRHITYIS